MTPPAPKFQSLNRSYPVGCPRYAALIASHESLQFCRRFRYLRARLFLYKQDYLSLLEDQLKTIDSEETHVLYLSSSRLDVNEKRKTVLEEIDRALEDYDGFIQRSSQVLQSRPPQQRDVQNLQNWIEGNLCLARHQSAYVTEANRRQELMELVTPDDTTVSLLEIFTQNFLTHFRDSLFHRNSSNVSSDPHVRIYSGVLPGLIARVFIALLIMAYLLAPVIVCNTFVNLKDRMIVIAISTTLFITTLLGLLRVRTIDLFVAGSTYATVLTVFVTTTN
ncbi:hypothetical protein ASPBRDRAFT_281358 [Aspergillus brasiliensis CBS 101740]|uniref:DUF6594 domain-containing protein n=1 Tax=Aspergillus brasiliensis (strain CBS 101740 / IMI 381727 / IBT 21946) TaxID=767769 RepID=A0A1L9UD07_ASPBC|nr:hypothetical protein ASPBRDRAFT_281358 [Aspergillus brasiliensis CBS 101740]